MGDNTRDRAIGALVGLAVGDAVGTALEFKNRDSYPPLTDMVGGGPFELAPGQWTDDTSMALCLADSLLHAGDLDLHDLAARFVRWWREGENSVTGECFDIGGTTISALQAFQRSGNPRSGGTAPHTAANGALMRLSPVAIRWHQDVTTAADMARLQSETTHRLPIVLDASGVFAELLVDAINGAAKAEVLSPRSKPDLDALIADIAAGSWARKERNEIGSSGYVVHTLEAALWSVGRADSFEEAVLLAANLGGDADTVAAVTGQLAGALWGLSGIPDGWQEKLAWRDRIEGLAERLYEAGTVSN